MLQYVGPYRIDRKIGEGGMGVVYAAADERLGRQVALKTLHAASQSPDARERLWREARALASVSHPNICQIFGVEESDGALFLVMELLEGRSLAERLAEGALSHQEAVETAVPVLDALHVLHSCQIVHRDLKPSNIFLTPHGVKLLDFGLARPLAFAATPLGDTVPTQSGLTRPGVLAGTPYYMAPEQVNGQAAVPQTDLFAMGAVLYEMASGRRAFDAESMMEVFFSVVHREPPPLEGPLWGVVRRALSKRPADRHPSARAMADELLSLRRAEVCAPASRPATRLIALPFRVLRHDPDTDFLAYSLPDAISSSLSGIASLTVRSTMVAARVDVGHCDPRRIAEDADVNMILTGTLLRVGDLMRVSTQLMEAPGGTLIWSKNSDVSPRDIFQLQDTLVDTIVQSLMLPLTERERTNLKRDVPASATAYEFYLRANQVCCVRTPENMAIARDLYEKCVLNDPNYAPAWARLARCHRFLEKFVREGREDFLKVEQAFARAFELNPDLPLAHNLYTQLEADLGRAREAMVRLLGRAHHARSDPDLFAGLVQACRYCGQLRASVAAHEHTRLLDAHATTSVPHTYFAMCEFDKAIETYRRSGFYLDAAAMAALGREEHAAQLLAGRRELAAKMGGAVARLMQSLASYLARDTGGSLAALEAALETAGSDPEALYYAARQMARAGEAERAVSILSEVVQRGFWCSHGMRLDPWLTPLSGRADFAAVLERSLSLEQDARQAFLSAGGSRILG